MDKCSWNFGRDGGEFKIKLGNWRGFRFSGGNEKGNSVYWGGFRYSQNRAASPEGLKNPQKSTKKNHLKNPTQNPTKKPPNLTENLIENPAKFHLHSCLSISSHKLQEICAANTILKNLSYLLLCNCEFLFKYYCKTFPAKRKNQLEVVFRPTHLKAQALISFLPALIAWIYGNISEYLSFMRRKRWELFQGNRK